MTKFRWIALIVSALVIILAGTAVIFFFFIPEEDNTAPHLKNFTTEEQQKKAQTIVDELNTHDPAKVNVIRGNNLTDPKSVAALDAQNKTIASALPATGCHYRLKSVDNKGELAKQSPPGLTKESRVYRLDLNVDEQCSGKPPQSRTLGLYLIPYWGYWTPLSFAN